MKTSELQSLIALVRQQINEEHNEIVYQKFLRNNYRRMCIRDEFSTCDKIIQRASSRIARLVIIQKSLKKEINEAIQSERAVSAGWPYLEMMLY